MFTKKKCEEKPIRVLHVVPYLQAAGVETLIMNYYREMDHRKVQFDFLTHYKETSHYDKEVEEMGGHIYRLTIRNDARVFKYLNDLNVFFRDHKEYSIVHGHMESFGYFYHEIAKMNKIETRIAHSHIAFHENNIKGTVKYLLKMPWKNAATDLFACSKRAGDYMFGKRKFTVVNNAIDVEKFAFKEDIRLRKRNELGIEGKFVIGHVGRFFEQKNHKYLIDIFKKVKEKEKRAVLLLVGSGVLEKEIRDKVNSFNLQDCVIFLGIRNDIEKLYFAMDRFLLPSLYEGLPVSGVEAQATGLKCVFSSEVTEEAAIVDNISFIPLNANIEIWVDSILKESSINRSIRYLEVAKKGFDIKLEAKKMQEYYLEKSNRNNRIHCK